MSVCVAYPEEVKKFKSNILLILYNFLFISLIRWEPGNYKKFHVINLYFNFHYFRVPQVYKVWWAREARRVSPEGKD